MNGEKIETLKQLLPAKDELIELRSREDLPKGQRKLLDKALMHLNKIERTILIEIGNQLICNLTEDADKLKQLINEIEQKSDALKTTSKTISQAVSIVEALIKVVSTATSVGLS
ncbi:hypothetical protein [Fibrella forsythiae]|uniref:Mobilization protein n=1 Tax=Fibrella forsythiae TaxID=2817061 RepID=A0ABS3JIF7_9BACT|nr:hypothetical protein [Fibrella forsythiae]MBO0949201.1 hypothetical protein [Fibrella forsythiae]